MKIRKILLALAVAFLISCGGGGGGGGLKAAVWNDFSWDNARWQ